MSPTPANDGVNVDLLALIPARAPRVVEAGCSVGALAKEYRAANLDTDYIELERVRRARAGIAAACSKARAACSASTPSVVASPLKQPGRR